MAIIFAAISIGNTIIYLALYEKAAQGSNKCRPITGYIVPRYNVRQTLNHFLIHNLAGKTY